MCVLLVLHVPGPCLQPFEHPRAASSPGDGLQQASRKVWFRFHQKSKTCKHTDSKPTEGCEKLANEQQMQERKCQTKWTDVFHKSHEGLIQWSQTIWHAEHEPGEAGGVSECGTTQKHKRKHFVSLCVLFFLNIYFLCFKQTHLSHMQ